MSEAVERLRAVPFFAELDDDALERIARLATEAEFPAHAVLIERGQPGSGMFVILDGSVRVELRDRRVGLGPGDFVGELSLLVDDLRRAARVIAETPVRCLAISRPDFADCLESDPTIALAMLRVVAKRLGEMLDTPR